MSESDKRMGKNMSLFVLGYAFVYGSLKSRSQLIERNGTFLTAVSIVTMFFLYIGIKAYEGISFIAYSLGMIKEKICSFIIPRKMEFNDLHIERDLAE